MAQNGAKGSGSSLITSGGPKITEKESEIRDELEEEVERGLEDEIKDGIYRLALSLRRVYESQEERRMRPKEWNNAQSRMKSVSEVNISIKMDGGTKVEIREAKKEARSDKIRKGSPQSLGGGCRSTGDSTKRLEWAKSLRSIRVSPGSPNKAKKRPEPFRFGL